MKSLRIIFILLFAYVIQSCSNAERSGFAGFEGSSTPSSSYSESDEYIEAEDSEKNSSEDILRVKDPSKIIKNGSIAIEVEELDTAMTIIKKHLRDYKAYVSNEEEHDYSYMREVTMTIRVPGAEFDDLVEKLTKAGEHLRSKNINMLDVSEEFVDIEARLKTKREVEKRYTEILQQARTINEILEVENELRVIREEIEAREGRMKYLQDQVQYGTITLVVTQHYDGVYDEGFWGKVGNAFSGGWKGLKGLLIGILYLWPMWLILGVVFVLLRRYLRKKK